MSHYFSERPLYGRLKTRRFTTVIRGVSFTFVTGPGVFSSSSIDSGSLLLAENMILKDNATVLDLGCGYGVLGIVYAKLCPSSTVYMVDVNELALELARMNVKLNNVRNVKVRKSDLYSNISNMSFDVVICNPPVSLGMNFNERLIKETYEHLNNDGIFQVVYPLKMSDRFLEVLKKYFRHVETLARSGTHKVFIAYR
ncbi:MAG: class I SAM-dependent methyltransferase [Crenarchaeota archaeon]|nr:class I SAM-dependent methyltransferase [Thermoproteota archaeon]